MWASIRAAGAFHADSRRYFFRFYVQIFIFVMVLSCGYKLGAFLWRSCWSCSSSCLDLLQKFVESAPSRFFSGPNQHTFVMNAVLCTNLNIGVVRCIVGSWL